MDTKGGSTNVLNLLCLLAREREREREKEREREGEIWYKTFKSPYKHH